MNATTNERPMVELRGVSKNYKRGRETVQVLDDVSLSLPAASYVALMGPSGSGKSTLLNLVAGLDRPTSGSAFVAGTDLAKQTNSALAEFRSTKIGFVFQQFNLMPVLTAQENVELALLKRRLSAADRRARAVTALRLVGLGERLDHYPRQLSGGQEQRVAIARAIVNDPAIVVADEPTGDLDRKSADDILALLDTLNRDLGKTILMVTHDPHAAERATTRHYLDKGSLK